MVYLVDNQLQDTETDTWGFLHAKTSFNHYQ